MAAAAIAGRRGRFGGGGFSRTRYDEPEDDGPSMLWIGLFAVCGVALVVAGVVYAKSSYEDPRKELVAQYNDEVDLWTEKYRKEFAQSKFSWRILNPHMKEVTVPGTVCPPESDPADCTPTTAHTEEQLVTLNLTAADKAKIAWTQLPAAEKEDALARPQKLDDIHTYDELMFGAGGMFPEETKGEWDDADWTGEPYLLELRAETSSGQVQTFAMGPLPLLKQRPIGANQKMCRIHYGNNMHNGHCWDTLALSQICVQLNLTKDGWVGDKNGNIGCTGHDAAVYDKHCPGTARLLSPHTATCDFSLVNITVRSAQDPHVAAMMLTAGSLNFGPTPGENWQSGIVMLAVGGVLLLPVLPVLYLNLFAKRRSYHEHMMTDFDSIRTGSSRSRSISPHTRVVVGDYDQDAVYADGDLPKTGTVSQRGGAKYAAQGVEVP